MKKQVFTVESYHSTRNRFMGLKLKNPMKIIYVIKASSRVKGTSDEFKNTMLLSAHRTEEEAISRMEKLECFDNYLEWEYEIESVVLK